MIERLASLFELLLKTSWRELKMQSQTNLDQHNYDQKLEEIARMINEMTQILKDHNKIVKTSS